MRAKLKLIRDSDKSRVFDVSVPQFIIGRNDGCQLRPNSDAISRRHCAILLQDDKVVVRDMGSRNGTYVNDVAIGKQEETLITGDILQVGPLKFEVAITDDSGIIAMPTDSRLRRQKEAEESGESGLISQWLLDADQMAQSHRTSDSESRQFQLAEPTETDEPTGSEPNTIEAAKVNKKKPGKLPPRPTESTQNTQEAAAQTLKKLFTRGT